MSAELVVLFPVSIGCDVLGQILFKLGADGNISGNRRAANFWIALGVAVYAFETFVWLRILSLAPLSLAFPIAATNFLGVTLASRYLFKEQVGHLQWLGVALVTLGVIAVAST